jgi:23S rRNA pseudouridine1911/1915/1917 synthase
MTTETLQVYTSGERLDVFLASNIASLSRSAAQKLIIAGLVTLNGKSVSKNHKISAGESYVAMIEDAVEAIASPENIPLDIVYEDNDVIIINKPKGMVVHPAPGHPSGTLVNALLWHCGDSLSGIGGVKRPGIVHRIDKDTSGLIIAAKNDKAHLALSAQLSDRSLTREYSAIVRGVIKYDNGIIDAPIGRNQKDRKKQAVTAFGSRSAITHYHVVDRFSGKPAYPGFTHVSCSLETGRTHQIRVHMAHISHPILGDTVYGMKKPELGISSQVLHARRLKFIHPTTGEPVELSTDLPEYFKEILAKLERMYQ